MLGWGHWASWPCGDSHDGKETGNCIAANFGTAIAACAGRRQQAMLLLRKLQHKFQPNDPNAVACYSAV